MRRSRATQETRAAESAFQLLFLSHGPQEELLPIFVVAEILRGASSLAEKELQMMPYLVPPELVLAGKLKISEPAVLQRAPLGQFRRPSHSLPSLRLLFAILIRPTLPVCRL